MAEEFVDVCFGLWNSYEADAFLLDKKTGQYVDPKKFHLLNHKGTYYSVRGPLNVPRPVQGRPTIIQAGQSEPARELSARVADCVFTMQAKIATAREFYSDIKGRLKKYGRLPGSLRILPGVSVYVGHSRDEANEKFDYLQSLTPVDFAVKQLGTLLGGMDFIHDPLDGPIPPLVPNAAFVDPEQLARPYREKNFTLRQFALRMAATKSHLTLIGSADDIADQLEDWFRNGAADGFIVLPPYIPGCLIDFIDLVLPALRRRNLFRTEYAGATLRENLLGATSLAAM
jgi:FMN-dependent oxidoreductase (nitrilotriacetate monooxygenase family)